MPRPNARVRLNSYQKAQLAQYVHTIIMNSSRNGLKHADPDYYLEKAKRSVVHFLKEMNVGAEQADIVARNLLPLFTNYRSGDIDYIEDIVYTVCDDSS